MVLKKQGQYSDSLRHKLFGLITKLGLHRRPDWYDPTYIPLEEKYEERLTTAIKTAPASGSQRTGGKEDIHNMVAHSSFEALKQRRMNQKTVEKNELRQAQRSNVVSM